MGNELGRGRGTADLYGDLYGVPQQRIRKLRQARAVMGPHDQDDLGSAYKHDIKKI